MMSFFSVAHVNLTVWDGGDKWDTNQSMPGAWTLEAFKCTNAVEQKKMPFRGLDEASQFSVVTCKLVVSNYNAG